MQFKKIQQFNIKHKLYDIQYKVRMKNSNSRDKNSRTQIVPPSNNLMRTNTQQPKQQEMQRTGYGRPASGKKIESAKNLPPKMPPQKREYIVEDHMTESKIYEAKQGLQLLKKKMVSKGMSRQKMPPTQQNLYEKPPSMKSVQSNKTQDTQYYENRNNNVPPKKAMEKKYEPEQTQNKPNPKTTSSKNINDMKSGSQNDKRESKPTPQNQRKQPVPVYQQYRDQNMEIPIKPKKDFNALLEQQLRKQNQGKKNIPISNNTKPSNKNAYNQMSQFPDEQNLQMVQCQHCQRKFSSVAINKHEQICLKVFMTKRKAFDSAAHRAPEVQGGGFEQIKPKKQDPKKGLQKTQAQTQNQNQMQNKKREEKKEQEVPKWKAASLAFRANLKQAKGVALTQQEKQMSDIAQGLVPCNYCGRKFNEKAAAKHIPFCETKSKQIPKMTTTMQKKR